MFRRLLGGGGRAAEDATARGAAAGDGEDPLDLEAALAGLGGNQGLLEKILSKFADTAPRESDNARAYYQSREFEDLRRTAHSMKGSSGYLKAGRLCDLSIALQSASEGDAYDAWMTELDRVLSRVLREV